MNWAINWLDTGTAMDSGLNVESTQHVQLLMYTLNWMLILVNSEFTVIPEDIQLGECHAQLTETFKSAFHGLNINQLSEHRHCCK